MNAKAFRHFYEYHFAQNRLIWNAFIVSLSHEQFVQPVNYSMGSVRNQVVHLMSVDAVWFGDLSGNPIAEFVSSDEGDDRELIRSHWDTVEQMMRDYLASVRDDILFEKPFAEGEDKDLILWQVLLHVGNHGTDHRAQILRILSDLGVKTPPQDYIFYAYDHLEI